MPRGAFGLRQRAASDTLALPIYSELTESQQRHVVDVIAAFYAPA